MTMNPEIKQKWVEALRSGKYQQGKKYLKTVDGKFCCLGVLCDILGAEWVDDIFDSKIPKSDPIHILSLKGIKPVAAIRNSNNEYGVLPKVYQDLAGLSSSTVDVLLVKVFTEEDYENGKCSYGDVGKDYNLSTELVELNDDYGYTFDQIADVIEEYL